MADIDVLRVYRPKQEYLDDPAVIKIRQWAATTDTNELVMRRLDGNLHFIGNYDDSGLRETVNTHTQEITELQTTVETHTSEITELQSCVDEIGDIDPSTFDDRYVNVDGDVMTGRLMFGQSMNPNAYIEYASNKLNIFSNQSAMEINSFTAPMTVAGRGLTFDGGVGSVKLTGQGLSGGGVVFKTESPSNTLMTRNLTPDDIPNLNMSKITQGSLDWSRIANAPQIGGGGGVQDIVCSTAGTHQYARQCVSGNPSWTQIMPFTEGGTQGVLGVQTINVTGNMTINFDNPNASNYVLPDTYVLILNNTSNSNSNVTLNGDSALPTAVNDRVLYILNPSTANINLLVNNQYGASTVHSGIGYNSGILMMVFHTTAGYTRRIKSSMLPTSGSGSIEFP